MIKSHKKTIYEILSRGPVHPFPARMAPGIALELVAKENGPLRVLDPMMGSGTVLAIARSKGHYAIGVDIDPLAVLIAKVWTTSLDRDQVVEKAHVVLQRARTIFDGLAVRDAYPVNSDDATKQFVRYWFDPYARRQLTSLATAISRTHDPIVRKALWCAFSRLIITKQSGASRAMDLSHSRPHRQFKNAPAKPFTNFISAVERVVDNCIDNAEANKGPAPSVIAGDARNLQIKSNSIDLVLTSPPYLNAIDYIRCSKFSLVWMGYDVCELRGVRSASVGAEVGQTKDDAGDKVESVLIDLKLTPALSSRNEAILRRFVSDMFSAMGEVSRVLKPGGRAIYVVGENTIRGTYVRNSAIVDAIAKSVGLKLTERRSRNLPANRRYLPPPVKRGGKDMLDVRMRREVVLAFQK